MHHVYIVYSPSKNRFYIGETEDFEVRLAQHNSGFYKGSSTSIASDWRKFLLIECKGRSQARRLELFIKKQKSRKFIERLKNESDLIESILRKLK